MKLSASIDLIWNFAAKEAIAAHFSEIGPEHFLAALLKFSELPTGEMGKVAAGQEVVKQLAGEIEATREELLQRRIDSTMVRRRLRAQLGTGTGKYDGGVVHRSEAGKSVFDTAARIVSDQGNSTITAANLLEAILAQPTPVIADVLGNAAGPKKAIPDDSPLLMKYGKDLSLLPPSDKSPGRSETGYEAACKALARVLVRPRPTTVLLVGNEESSDVIVTETARALASMKPKPDTRTRRIVDVRSAWDGSATIAENTERLVNLFSEAVELDGVVLAVPPVGTTGGSAQQREWANLLKSTLGKGSAACICGVTPIAYCKYIENDTEWKRLAHTMWIRNERQDDMPGEI